jgi:hypothetical protein
MKNNLFKFLIYILTACVLSSTIIYYSFHASSFEPLETFDIQFDQLLPFHSLFLNSNQSQAAYVYFPHLSSHEVTLPVKSSLLAYVLVYSPTTHFMHQALPDFAPDSIHISIQGSQFMSVPFISHSPFQQHLLKENITLRMYHTQFKFQDVDTFKIYGNLEYVNYQWNYEKYQDVFWNPTPLQFASISSWTAELSLKDSLSVKVRGKAFDIHDYESLPYCSRGDHPGRWVHTNALKQSTLSFMLQTNSSHKWIPYDCKYREIGYDEFRECLHQHHPLIHFYGDSNIRRSLKALTTSGAWCSTMYNSTSEECQCKDWHLDVPYMNVSIPMNKIYNVAGGDTKIFFYSAQGFLRLFKK